MWKFVKGIAWVVILFSVDAYATWLLWGWHGVPIGLPAISIWRAAGVSALASLFVLRISASDTALIVDATDNVAAELRNEKIDLMRTVLWFVYVAIIVLIGWIAKVAAG